MQMRDVCLFLWTNKANYDPYDVMILSMCPLYAISLRSSLNDNYLFKTHSYAVTSVPSTALQLLLLPWNMYLYRFNGTTIPKSYKSEFSLKS